MINFHQHHLSSLLMFLIVVLMTLDGWSALPYVSPPISLVFRDSYVGKGKVAKITNTSDKYIHECTFQLESSSGELLYTPKVFAITLEPHKTMEIGWSELEGKSIEPGHKVSVGCKGYLLSIKVIVP